MLHGYNLRFLTHICVHLRLAIIIGEVVFALQPCASTSFSHCCCWPLCAIKNGLLLQTWSFSLKYLFWLSDIFYKGTFEKLLYSFSYEVLVLTLQSLSDGQLADLTPP